MEPAEEGAEVFRGYDVEGERSDFKIRQGSCFVKDLPKGEIPDFLKDLDDRPRRASCVQMMNKDQDDDALKRYKDALLKNVDEFAI